MFSADVVVVFLSQSTYLHNGKLGWATPLDAERGVMVLGFHSPTVLLAAK